MLGQNLITVALQEEGIFVYVLALWLRFLFIDVIKKYVEKSN